MTITITITGDARTVRNELAELIGAYAAPAWAHEVRGTTAAEGAAMHAKIHGLQPGGVATDPPDDVEVIRSPAPAADPVPLTGDVIPPEEKPRRGRKPKAEAEAAPGSIIADYRAAMEAEEAAPMSAAEAETVMHADAVQEAPKEVPLEAVQNAIRDVASRFDTDACKALLQQFGAAKSSEVKPADRAAFVQAAKEWKR